VRRIYLARGTREHRTPWADAVWWIGEADVGIKFRRNRRRKERHCMPHNERCRKPDSIGDKRRKKSQPARKEEQAGVLRNRVIGLSRERILIAHVWSMLFYNADVRGGDVFYKIYRTNLTEIHVGDGTVLYSPSIGYWAIPF